MKEILSQLNGAFDHRNRLGIMAVLVSANDWLVYGSLKTTLDLTDGNLASHLKALESLEFIEVQKQFVNRKPQTTYRATDGGRLAFEAHLRGLENLMRGDGATTTV